MLLASELHTPPGRQHTGPAYPGVESTSTR